MHSKIDLNVIFDNVPGVTQKDVNKFNVELASVDFEKAISLTGKLYGLNIMTWMMGPIMGLVIFESIIGQTYGKYFCGCFGKFHYLIVLMGGLIFASAGFQNGLNAYVMSAAQTDLSMTSSEKGLLNAVFLIGGLVSAFFWGIMADHVGRKRVLVYSLILDGIITMTSSLSQTFTIFAIFRFLNGFIIGAPGSIVVPYLGEFLGNNYRAQSLCAVGFFWTVSWMILPAAALGIIPLTWSFQVENFTFNSWRMYVAIFSLPALVCGALLALYFPESPKFLFIQGKENEALSILKNMYRMTYGNRQGEYPVKTILPEEKEGVTSSSIILNTMSPHDLSSGNSKPSLYLILKKIWNQAISLFSYPVISSTVLAAALTFTNMFGYYGLGLWLPELFNRFEEHYKRSNESVTVCEMTLRKNNYSCSDWSGWNENETEIFFPQELTESPAINPSVFVNTFIIGAVCLLANILAAILAKRLGLKLLTIVTMLISGVSAIGIYFLRTSTQNLVVSCIFLAFVGTGNTVINSAVVDLFPTKIRALAVCTAIFAGRLGAVASNLTIGYVLDISCAVPIFLMGFVLLSGTVLGFFLPSSPDKSANGKRLEN